jgi:hypothetical protein
MRISTATRLKSHNANTCFLPAACFYEYLFEHARHEAASLCGDISLRSDGGINAALAAYLAGWAFALSVVLTTLLLLLRHGVI